MSDDPFKTIKAEPVFVALRRGDPQLARCAQEAKTTLQLFSNLHERYKDTPGVYFAFKTAVPDGDQVAHLWYSLMEQRDGIFFGEHFQLPPELESHKKIQIGADQIEDWMINDYGVLYGGLTIRYQRSELPDDQKASFDEYAGIREYKKLGNLNEGPPAIVVGVPGFWPSIDVLQRQLEFNGRGWRLTGDVLEGPNGARFNVDIYEPDPSLRDSFAIAGRDRIPPGTIDSIKDHTFCVYVVARRRGLVTVDQLIDASAALLEAGGVAVKIESTGLAHSADTWLALANDPLRLSDVINCFVVYVLEKKACCSCGMHSFALPDASVARDADAQNLLESFNAYQFHKRPTLRDGDTFKGAGASVYRLFHKEYDLYPPGGLFHNPYGRWDLQIVKRRWWRAA